MTLSALIHKRRRTDVATATPATSATHSEQKGRSVATVATVAVAKPAEDVTARAWLLHYSDRDPVEIWRAPPATHSEILAANPEAIAAEPLVLIEADRPAMPQSCKDCRHRARPGHTEPGYCAMRTDTPHAYGPGHPLHLLPEDGGTGCKHFEEWA